MSQPPDYFPPPPPGPQASPEELLGPARRAGTLMMAVGVLAVLSGLCFAYQANRFDAAELPAEIRTQMEQQIRTVEAQLGASFRTLMLVVAAVPLLVGAVTGAVGLYVRNGGLATIVIGIVSAAIMLLAVGFALLAGLIQGAAMGPAVLVVSVCFYGVPFAMLLLLMLWLVQAARVAPRLEEARRRQQARQWQSEQRQEAFRQEPGTHAPGQPPPQPRSGLGYSYPPPPAKPPDPSQPRPDDESKDGGGPS